MSNLQLKNKLEDYISISTLNDFIFCPYSIYLHNVYMDVDDDVYYATPQNKGKIAHEGIDKKTYSHRKNDILSLPIYSDELGVMGKIDLYKQDEKLLIERKYQLKQIYRGQLYQLWAQYFCLIEMGDKVEKIAFYEISTNKMYNIDIPTLENKIELKNFICQFKSYNPSVQINVNINKCMHCIYCNLCDKIDVENVY